MSLLTNWPLKLPAVHSLSKHQSKGLISRVCLERGSGCLSLKFYEGIQKYPERGLFLSVNGSVNF